MLIYLFEKEREEIEEQLYENIYNNPVKLKLNSLENGETINIIGIGYCKSRFDYTILLDKCGDCYYGNTYINKIILEGWGDNKPVTDFLKCGYIHGRKVYYLNTNLEVIGSVTKIRDAYYNNHKYAYCKYTGNPNIKELNNIFDDDPYIKKANKNIKDLEEEIKKIEQDKLLKEIEEEIKNIEQDKLLKEIDYKGKVKDLIKFENLEEGEQLYITGLQLSKFRGKEIYILQDNENKYYKGNYFVNKKIKNIPKKYKNNKFYIIIESLRYTPTRKKIRNSNVVDYVNINIIYKHKTKKEDKEQEQQEPEEEEKSKS